MAEQVRQESNIVPGTALDVLSAAYAAGRKVRFWLNSGGSITGVWLGRNGKTCAAVTATCAWASVPGTKDTCRVYFGMDIAGSWSNPCRPATREAMLAYRAEQIALLNA